MNQKTMTASEYRIKKNYLKRKKQLCHRIKLVVLTFTLVLISSVLLFSMKTDAKDSHDVVYYKYYKSITVDSGETLWDLAKEYSIGHYTNYDDYVNEVIHMNALNDDSLKCGQSIIIPFYSSNFVG